MKTLVIGMDGAQIDTFTRGWTPFIESLIKKGGQLDLKEDLISRGWAEIFTGKHGLETGALYDRPCAKGNLNWSLRFEARNISGFGTDTKPLWQVLNERGYRVGIMNVPTTFPAPAVDGFFVSGGGGGSKLVQEPTEEMCYPKDILDSLIKIGYIVDERIGSLIYEKKYSEAKDIFLRLEEKNQKRTEAFIKLTTDYDVDFGFIVYKSSSVMAELFTIPEWNRFLNGAQRIDDKLIEAVKKYYQDFDKQLKHLVESFSDTEVILVSDHSMTQTKYLVNLNIFLQKHGFQYTSAVSNKVDRITRYVKKCIKPLMPFNLRHTIRQKANVKSILDNPVLFDPEKTLAFCIPKGDWATGIYINDQKRFGGPVDSSETLQLAQKISLCINNHQIASTHDLKSYVKAETKSPASRYFPDVIIDCPDGYIVSNTPLDFIVKFDMPKCPVGINTWINNYKPYCGKAHFPIAVNTNHWLPSPSKEKHDLTLIYDHILATFD